MTFNARKQNDVDKGENNMHKQRKLANDERLSKDQTGMKRIFDGYQRVPKDDIRFSCVGLCGTRVTGPGLFSCPFDRFNGRSSL